MKSILLSIFLISLVFFEANSLNDSNFLSASQPSPDDLTIENMLNIDEECYLDCWWGLEVRNSIPTNWESLLADVAATSRIREISDFENSFYFNGSVENPRRDFSLQLITENNQLTRLGFSYTISTLGNVVSLAEEGTYGNMRDVFSVIGQPEEIYFVWNGRFLNIYSVYLKDLYRIRLSYFPDNTTAMDGFIMVCPSQTPVNLVQIFTATEKDDFDYNFPSETAMPLGEVTEYTVEAWVEELHDNPEACISMRIE